MFVRYLAAAAVALGLSAFPAAAETVRMFEPGEATAEKLRDALLPPMGKTRGLGSASETEPQPGAIGYRIEFAYDSARVEASNGPFLKELARMLAFEEFEESILVIEGHTDARGSEAYNMALSKRRALAVRDYLAERYGVDAVRLTVRGRGESAPLLPDDPAHAANRRVQFSLQ